MLLVDGIGRDRLPTRVRTLVSAEIGLYRVSPQEPTLEDVYFALLPVGLRLGADQLSGLQGLLDQLPEDVRRALGDGPLAQPVLIYVIEYQGASLFLFAPMMVTAASAADSLAGEKERKTLEALPYTPTTDLELYLAKLLGPVLAAVAVSFAGYGLYVASANLAATGETGRLLALTPLWLVVVAWLGPPSRRWVWGPWCRCRPECAASGGLPAGRAHRAAHRGPGGRAAGRRAVPGRRAGAPHRRGSMARGRRHAVAGLPRLSAGAAADEHIGLLPVRVLACPGNRPGDRVVMLPV